MLSNVNASRSDPDIRALSSGELDDVSGGIFALVVWAGWHIALGIAAGIAIASDGATPSAPGDYPSGPKDSA
jgi:hypothetical protein